MAKLTKTFEDFKNGQLQILQLCCEASSHQDLDNNSYDDYTLNLYINNKFIAEISRLFDDTELFTDLVDNVDWHELLNVEVTVL